MTKQDLVDKLAEGVGVPKAEVMAIIDGFLSLVMDSVAAGDRVELRRFGIWKPVIRKARNLRTPNGTREINIPAHATVVFVPTSEFRARISEGSKVNPPTEIAE